MDDNGHGTHIAGTISALNNDIGVIGSTPDSELYAIKVLDQYGNGNYSDIIAEIEWALANNMDILNMSFGGVNSSRTLKTAVDNAYKSGILLVASAGNYGYDKKGTITYPAKYDSVIAVGAVDEQNNWAGFSSVGRELELVAPGVNIISTVPGGYAAFNGTSMASPHVVGVASLVWSEQPDLNNIELRNILNQSSEYLGDPFLYGKGMVNALSAVTYKENTINKKSR
jgi:subtilisin